MPGLSILLALVLLAGSSAMAQDPAPTVPESDKQLNVQKAKVILSTARAYLDTKNLDEAEAKAVEALALAMSDPRIKAEAERLLRIALVLRREYTDLRHGERLKVADHLRERAKFDEASVLYKEILDEAQTPALLRRASEGLKKSHPGWSGVIPIIADGLRDLAPWVAYGLILILVYLSLRGVRWIYSKVRPDKWIVEPIADETQLGLNQVILASLSRFGSQRPPITAGLLKLEASELPPAVEFDLLRTSADLSGAFEALPQVGGVSLAAVANMLSIVPKWFNAKRGRIRGVACVSADQIVVRLTCRRRDGKILGVSASGPATLPDQGAVVAERASFKMYYLIAKEDATLAESDAVAELQEGLTELEKYLNEGDSGGLNKALDIFARVSNKSPELEQAQLYEGIALDLAEQHDQAIQHFRYLQARSEGTELGRKAAYNEAISHYRKYRPEELENAVKILEKLDSDDLTKLKSDPVAAFAHAAKANAIAHKAIFWKDILSTLCERLACSDDPTEIAQYEKQIKDQLDDWLAEVEEIADRLAAVDTCDDTIWDGSGRRQLDWTIHNARGNGFLNYAWSFLNHFEPAADAAISNDLFDRALEEFRQCEMLLPAGVETLTNIATTMLALGRWPEARQYAEKAIALNRGYEYAYFRLAMAWDAEGRVDEVLKVLRRFATNNQHPKIPSFKKLYQRCAFDLALS